MLTLTDIYIYPIKSLGGIRRETARLEERGLQYDRRWLLTDEHGRFLTQRKFAKMALLAVTPSESGFQVVFREGNFPALELPFALEAGQEKKVEIWGDQCRALAHTDAADEWFSAVLGQPCRLVYMPDFSQRPVDPDYAQRGEIVSFADAYPYLIIGQAALDLLNEKLAEPVPMDRFRPNLVFSGGLPHVEDQWRHFRIGPEVEVQGVKPCARCVVTTIDQQTAVAGKEPLRTLATYRTQNGKVMFGQNLLPVRLGTVRVGDDIEVLTHNSQGPA